MAFRAQEERPDFKACNLCDEESDLIRIKDMRLSTDEVRHQSRNCSESMKSRRLHLWGGQRGSQCWSHITHGVLVNIAAYQFGHTRKIGRIICVDSCFNDSDIKVITLSKNPNLRLLKRVVESHTKTIIASCPSRTDCDACLHKMTLSALITFFRRVLIYGSTGNMKLVSH